MDFEKKVKSIGWKWCHVATNNVNLIIIGSANGLLPDGIPGK